jgi:hypothetical protein
MTRGTSSMDGAERPAVVAWGVVSFSSCEEVADDGMIASADGADGVADILDAVLSVMGTFHGRGYRASSDG